jgi:hypothetical protein
MTLGWALTPGSAGLPTPTSCAKTPSGIQSIQVINKRFIKSNINEIKYISNNWGQSNINFQSKGAEADGG